MSEPTRIQQQRHLLRDFRRANTQVSRDKGTGPTLVTPTGFRAPVAKTLPEVVQRIVQALQPEKIVLFGSYAYGTPTPDSDVDLLVVMETSEPFVERYLAVSRLLRPRPFPVDILVKTPDEITYALKTGDFFIREILSQGQVLYERNH